MLSLGLVRGLIVKFRFCLNILFIFDEFMDLLRFLWLLFMRFVWIFVVIFFF